MSDNKKAIKQLAIRYAAFVSAVEILDHNAIIIWGQSLINSQDTLGVSLIEEKTILNSVRLSFKAIKKAADKEAHLSYCAKAF